MRQAALYIYCYTPKGHLDAKLAFNKNDNNVEVNKGLHL